MYEWRGDTWNKTGLNTSTNVQTEINTNVDITNFNLDSMCYV